MREGLVDCGFQVEESRNPLLRRRNMRVVFSFEALFLRNKLWSGKRS